MRQTYGKKKKPGKLYKLSEGQIANVVLAARGQSGCSKARKFVKKIDVKFKLKKKAKR